jgi:phosphoglucomutase
LEKARELDADILLGTDPDADRVGIAIKNQHGEWVLMNGNQTALLAFNYVMEARKAKGVAEPNDFVVKTIVTTYLIDTLAEAYGVNCYNVLTGFKWIGELIKEKEKEEHYIIGGEESYGLMVGSQVRDKDAVSAVAILCEMAAYEKNQGRSLFQKLLELYVQYGFYKEKLISITKKGQRGQQDIADMMENFRQNPFKELGGSPVKELLDYDKGSGKNLQTGETWPIELPKSNVLQFILEDGSRISARPSGTEPKIKFYFSVKSNLPTAKDFDTVNSEADAKIDGIIKEMNL